MKNLSFKHSLDQAWLHKVKIFLKVYKETFDKTKVALDSPLMMPPNSMLFTKFLNLLLIQNELDTSSDLYSEINQIVGTKDFEVLNESNTHTCHDLAVYILMIKNICEWSTSQDYDTANFSVLEEHWPLEKMQQI